MFLKRLEVQGFKSFADRMMIDFVPGVTAVVGPNGSGKSNISDGIRWVLGEQSAKSLRGAKMEDIIFAGSDTRKPLNFAEITLVLDNEDGYFSLDYSEISVTRRVFRSGESEYLINKQSCRLKDIVDLLMDSGLGREAFSIIGQGKVEEILSSKSEDRRVIFEEAAGVLKYKTRKIKAERKLFETQDNLIRVDDILHELENQLEPLQIQASVAKEFLQKKEELKREEVALLVCEIEDLHTKWLDEKRHLEDFKLKKAESEVAIHQDEALLSEAKIQLQKIDKEMNDLQAELLDASEKLEKGEGLRVLLKERKKNFHQNKEMLLKTVDDLQEEAQKLEGSYIKETEALKEIESVVRQLNEERELKTKRLHGDGQEIDAQLEGLKSDYIEVLNEQASLRNEKRYISDQLKQQRNKRDRLLNDNTMLLQKRDEIEERKEDASKTYKDTTESLDDITDLYRTQKAELEKAKANYEANQKQLYEAYQLLQQIRSRKDVLEEMQADFSGFFQGVKEILKARNKELHGIVGAVAELISVPKELETAIDIALGASSQYIITNKEEDARRAISFLKSRRYGRATFLPLTVIRPRMLAKIDKATAERHASFKGVATNLITYENEYDSVMSNLLGNVLIAQDLAGANDLAKQLGFKYKIVTLDGDVVNPGGSMTGGSSKQQSSALIGRTRELESLKEKLVIMEEKVASREQLLRTLKETIEDLEQRFEGTMRNGELLREKQREVKATLREVEVEEKNINERLALYDREQDSFMKEKVDLESRLQQIDNKLEEASVTIANLDATIKELEEKKRELISSKRTTEEEVTQIKIYLAKEEERFANQKVVVNRLKEEKRTLENRLNEAKENLYLLEGEWTENSNGEGSLVHSIEKNRERKENAIHLLTTSRLERTKVQEQLDVLEENIKQLSQQVQYVTNLLVEAEVKVNRLDVALENRLTQLREEYELSFEAAKEKYTLVVPLEEARTTVKLLKLSIEELGTVNLGAIEEYDRILERFTFLHEQRSDLVKAKDTLHNVITEMDSEMSNRFEQSFSQIKVHFQSVYKVLFGGGEADLILTNPENLLETGVDIVARPPGKKLQHLALLSGGERALTAIALLFAILKVRPVPFCVLDEVEAALDEANVSRFANYLKEFSEQTQFIVITHRKGTMEEADVLYGVTMQESGVSKLVSVRLEESEQLIPGI